MWKIVKAELSYLKLPILLSYAAFMGVSFASPLLIRLHTYRPSGMEYLADLIIGIILVHIAVNLISLYLDIREVRIRQVAVLPIPNAKVGIARMAMPFVLVAVYIVLAVTCALILLAMYPERPFDPHVPSDEHIQDTLSSITKGFGVWLAVTYTVRLFSEWQGRVLLVSFLILLVFHGSVLSLFSRELQWLVADYCASAFAPPLGHYVPLLVALTLCCLIQGFFTLRKAYLQ